MATACKSVADAADAMEILSTRSAFLDEVASAQSHEHYAPHARTLSANEQAVFTRNGNVGTIKVVSDGKDCVEVIGRIRNCEFLGTENLLVARMEHISTGDWSVRDTAFEKTIIEAGATVNRTTLISKCILRASCLVMGCGLISGTPEGQDPSAFGNGLVVSPGLETGGRAVQLTVESSLELLARVSLDQFREPDAKRRFDSAVNAFCRKCTSNYTIVSARARVMNTSKVISSFIGASAIVSSGARVAHSTLLEGAVVEQGSDVIRSLLQRKTHASTQAIVKDSLICEGGSVEVQGKLLNSVLGPGSHLAEGEISSSLIGPMVGFHHQSMLIATFWPSGRGNVGYGANCGSNHTSRVSDQTMWPGEGVFFGLGCCVKFPLNLSEAPYTVIATGVVYGPGRLAFPMSLVTSDTRGCRVAPGWGFASNAYALERNSTKMKSRAPKGYAWEITRPEIATLVGSARDRLKAVLQQHPAGTKVFQDDPKNDFHLAGGYCTRDDIEKGILAYTKFLELYALRGAMQLGITTALVHTESTPVRVLEFDVADTGLVYKDDWIHRQHVLELLPRLFPVNLDIRDAYLRAETAYVKNVFESKARDHVRGRHVFPAGRYDEAISLDKDSVIETARQRLEDLKSRI